MDKRILIFGSIIAVIILIFASFNSVVGFQSNEVSSKRASPLFNVRSKNAIDECNPTITCGYIGNGKKFTIPIPIRGWEFNLIQNTLERIKKMEGDEFREFIAELSHYLENEPEMTFMNSKLLRDSLYQAKVNPGIIINNPIFKRDVNPFYTKSPSQGDCCTCNNEPPNCDTFSLFSGGEWNLDCYIRFFLLLVILMVGGVIIVVINKMCEVFPRIAELVTYFIAPGNRYFIKTSD
jgi:hypothetical protein